MMKRKREGENRLWRKAAVIFGMTALLMVSKNVSASTSVFDNLNQDQIVTAMGAGWNLGNQLEASTPEEGQGETLWGNPTITYGTFQAVKAAGFDTVRIPVSWLAMIGEGPDYIIDQAWLDRVQEVVDYAIGNGLFVILDIHNDGSISVDGSWILTNAADQNAVRDKFGKVWKQIAVRFKDYDEHLIFESMNEVGAESSDTVQEIESAINLINSYNEVFVNAVRQAGGNNDKRWLMIPGWNTNVEYTAGNYGFTVPADIYLSGSIPQGEKRIMVSVHYYTPWEFCGQEDGAVTSWGDGEPGTITWANEAFMKNQFETLNNVFVSKGYPVVLGEYGCVNKQTLDSGNDFSRAYYVSRICEYAKENKIVPVYWDNGNIGPFGLALFNRWNGFEVTQPLILSAIMYYYGEGTSATVDIVQSNLEFVLGDAPKALTALLAPAGAKEWIVWKSGDESIVTVNRYGEVTAVGIGQTIISASIGGHQDSCIVTVTAPEDGRIKLYMQNSDTWTMSESSSYASVTGDGTYSVSITGSSAAMSNVTLLYLQDVCSYFNTGEASVISSADIVLNSVTFNGTVCPLSATNFTYDSSGGGMYIGLLNCWGITYLTNAVHGMYDGMSFTGVTYQSQNTITVTFTLSNTVMNSGGTGTTETVLFQEGIGYSATDASWLLNAPEEAAVKIKYTCTDASQAYWGILGWGAMVNGTWVNGPVYTADGTHPTSEQTVVIQAGQLRNTLGITQGSDVTYLSLSPYNSGKLLYLSITW